MNFPSTLLSSNSIWGVSIYPHCKQVRMEREKLSKLTRPTLPLPLKGGSEGESAEDALQSILCKVLVFTPIFQPFKIIRFLIQCGYEPVRPYSVKGRGFIDFLMDRRLSTYTYLPGIIGYSQELFRRHGPGCFWAGLGPSFLEAQLDLIVEGFWELLVDSFLLHMFNFDKKEEKHPYFDTKQVLMLSLKNSILSLIVLLHSYPLFVVGNVSILRCIKGEPSAWIWTIVLEVWNEAGITGFYSGFVALFAYRLVNVWCEQLSLELIRLLMQRLNEDHANDTNKSAYYNIAHWIISSFTYPLNLIGNIMSVNKCSARIIANKLPYLPVFGSWIACFRYMYNAGIWFRGSSVLQRRLVRTET